MESLKGSSASTCLTFFVGLTGTRYKRSSHDPTSSQRYYLPQLTPGGHPPPVQRLHRLLELKDKVQQTTQIYNSHRPLSLDLSIIKTTAIAISFPLRIKIAEAAVLFNYASTTPPSKEPHSLACRTHPLVPVMAAMCMYNLRDYLGTSCSSTFPILF